VLVLGKKNALKYTVYILISFSLNLSNIFIGKRGKEIRYASLNVGYSYKRK